MFAISKIFGKSACSIFEQPTPNFNDVCFTSKRNVGLEKGSARYFSACKENKSSKEWFFNIYFYNLRGMRKKKSRLVNNIWMNQFFLMCVRNESAKKVAKLQKHHLIDKIFPHYLKYTKTKPLFSKITFLLA